MSQPTITEAEQALPAKYREFYEYEADTYALSYVRSFAAVYPALTQKNDGVLLPFVLEGVAGDPGLNQPDGIHPTAEGHRIVAENLWQVLEPVLR